MPPTIRDSTINFFQEKFLISGLNRLVFRCFKITIRLFVNTKYLTLPEFQLNIMSQSDPRLVMFEVTVSSEIWS